MAVSQKNFDEAVKILTEKLDAVIRSQRDINKSIQSLTGEIATLKKDASDRDIKIGQLEKELEDQKLRCDQLENQVLESDVKDRKLNLLIHGMPTERPSQTVEENVKFFLSDTMEISDPIQITKCYRMLGGSVNVTNRRPRPAPIFISVVNEQNIQRILNSVRKLKGSGIRVCTDLPPKLNAIRNELLAKAKDLRESDSAKFTRVKQKGSKLWLESKSTASSPWERVMD